MFALCAGPVGVASHARSLRHTTPSIVQLATRQHSRCGIKCAAAAATGHADDDDDEGDSSASPGKPLRVERLLSNMGYGKRKECTAMIKRKQLVWAGTCQPAKVGEKALASQLLLNGEPLDPAFPLTLILHKPAGYVVTSPDDEVVLDPKVYDLLPYRFGRRKPFLSAVGRLDKDTSGLLLMTDDGQLLHSIQSPAKGIWKRYVAVLDAPLTGREADKAAQSFASGQLQLQGDRTPLLPAGLCMLDDTTAEVSICEGRYHQVKRMFTAVGRTVVQLHRHSIGGLTLDPQQLDEGSWRLATQADIDAVFSGPEFLAAVPQQQQSSSSQPPGAAGRSATSAAADNAGSTEDSSSDTEVDWSLEVDHPGEAAAAAKRYKSSTKRARRTAALARDVGALRAGPLQDTVREGR